MARPRRFPLRLLVRYRQARDARWHLGITTSISASGAIIEGDVPSASSDLVVAIDLPASGGCLIGRARVIVDRSAALPDAAHFAVAARFRLAHRR